MSYSVGSDDDCGIDEPRAELMEKELLARIALLEAACVALLRVHPVPEQARDELRFAAESLLVPLDDAPNASLASATALQYNALSAALCC